MPLYQRGDSGEQVISYYFLSGKVAFKIKDVICLMGVRIVVKQRVDFRLK